MSRQLTSACVSICQHTYAEVSIGQPDPPAGAPRSCLCAHASARLFTFTTQISRSLYRARYRLVLTSCAHISARMHQYVSVYYILFTTCISRPRYLAVLVSLFTTSLDGYAPYMHQRVSSYVALYYVLIQLFTTCLFSSLLHALGLWVSSYLVTFCARHLASSCLFKALLRLH